METGAEHREEMRDRVGRTCPHTRGPRRLTTIVRPMMECSPEREIWESVRDTSATPSSFAVTLPRSPTCLALTKHRNRG